MLETLTLAQRSILFILMGEAREVPNTYFTNERGYKLDAKIRDRLKDLGLINVSTRKNRLYLELSDLGWKECRAELAAPRHKGEGAVGVALYTLLELLQRHLEKSGTSFNNFFVPAEDAADKPIRATAEPPADQATDLEAMIRDAYRALARPGTWVKLAELRAQLGSIAKADLDKALVKMNRMPNINIVPESNQKSLSDKDKAAAVVIGNQNKHLISISS